MYTYVYMSKRYNKIVWSIRVSPELKEWFYEYAKIRRTDPQEEARRAMADFAEKHDPTYITDKNQEPLNGEIVPLRDSGKERS